MSEVNTKSRLLFLCTGNSCRSQMAEGIARRFYGQELEICSAGIEQHGMNPYAMEVMLEAGIDISGHSSKTLAETGVDFDFVVTVCDHAKDKCPVFPGKTKVYHFPFADPPKLAAGYDREDEKLECYRVVRREISAAMPEIVASLA